MEKCIKKEIMNFLTVKTHSVQHGFRPLHLCESQLLYTIHLWASSLDQLHALFLDFAEAFNSVPHRRLLLKLYHIGIRGIYGINYPQI